MFEIILPIIASTSGRQHPPRAKGLQATRNDRKHPGLGCRQMSWDRQPKAELRGAGHRCASREVASLLKTAIRLNSTHYQCVCGKSPTANYALLVQSRNKSHPKRSSPRESPRHAKAIASFAQPAGAPPAPAGSTPPRGAVTASKVQPDFHRKTISIRRFLLTARPISYIMLTTKSG